MRLWRIAQRQYALDKTCAGAARNGGRWNPVGFPALYCSTSISLCSLEKLIHTAAAPLPPLVLVAVDLPDDVAVMIPRIAALPPGWDAIPASDPAQQFGKDWFMRGNELAMQVPSVAVPEENNVVVNTRHQQYGAVMLSTVRVFAFDPRLRG